MSKLKKAALFTDIHLGRRNNSEVHNQDCIDYVNWLYNNIKADSKIDHVIFLGDFFDKRDAVNIATLNYAHQILTKLNSLGMPIYFLVGNHDIYNRNNRNLHSLVFFQEFKNIKLIENITVCDDTEVPILLSPYLFFDEYVGLLKYQDIPVQFIHGEFNGFVITGDFVEMKHGANPSDFSKPKRIFSGHFHKRQSKGNIHYIGNTFPMDFSDVNDVERGFATYEYSSDSLIFFNFEAGPSYIRTGLSTLLENHKKILKPKAVVRCVVDADLTMEESIEIKEKLMKKYSLREMTLEEVTEDLITESVEMSDVDNMTTGVLIRTMLDQIVLEKLRKEKIIEIYDNLK